MHEHPQSIHNEWIQLHLLVQSKKFVEAVIVVIFVISYITVNYTNLVRYCSVIVSAIL